MKTILLSATVLLLVTLFSGCAGTSGNSTGSKVNVNGAVSTSVETSF